MHTVTCEMNGIRRLHAIDCVHNDLSGILPFQLSRAIAPGILATIGWQKECQKCFKTVISFTPIPKDESGTY